MSAAAAKRISPCICRGVMNEKAIKILNSLFIFKNPQLQMIGRSDLRNEWPDSANKRLHC
jgi:hypothetical protein